MTKILSNNRGVALILVIMITGILIALTLQFNLLSRSELYEAANLRDTIRLSYIAKSGFYGGTALLMEDTNAFDSLNEEWAKAELLSAQSSSLFDEGYFRLDITDESGMIPISCLFKDHTFNNDIEDLLIRFLTLARFGLDVQEAGDIVDAIKDWIDEDHEVTGFGAENPYYGILEQPYPCKNGPLDSIEELLLIKGITRDLYDGTENNPGIRHYMTVQNTGTININTAPPPVLMALADGITEEMVSKMEEYRRNENNDLSHTSWYKEVPGMDGITIPPSLITTKSTIFAITTTGMLDRMSKTIRGVVKRDSSKKRIKILSWRSD